LGKGKGQICLLNEIWQISWCNARV
jgi:hypothetical protein